MHRWLGHSIWFNRLVLAAATVLFLTIARRGLFDPVGSSAVHEIMLGSNASVTVARVAFGGFPLAFAVILLICLVSERRLLMGLSALVVVSLVVTGARVLGIVLDGPAPFSMHVLKPEVGLVLASTTALLLERRRRQALDGDERTIFRSALARQGSQL